jgi:hypothetical protein
MQNPTRIFMGAAAGVVVGWVVAHYDTSPVIDPLRQAAHRVRHALLYLEGGEGYEDRRHERVNVPPATAPTFEEQIRDAAMANALDQLRPTPIPVDPNPEPVEVRDPFDHVLLPDPPPIAPTFDDPPVDPWFRPITTPDLPESVMDPDAEFLGGDGDALMFMLPDGTSATAEEYMDRLDRDTGREQL